jgi:hypothetical protein
LLEERSQGRLFQTFEDFEFRAAFPDFKNTDLRCGDGKQLKLPFSCLKLGRTFVVILAGYESAAGRYSGHSLLIYTCFCANTMLARFTANGNIRREIYNPQMFETDPKSFCPAIYFNNHCTSTSTGTVLYQYNKYFVIPRKPLLKAIF